ncbi:MAG: ankyrin repeat domain-containing protein [Methylotenera sp.]|nr:ankyrin repeat domain-containing protein [Oligoflexia bacterium]
MKSYFGSRSSLPAFLLPVIVPALGACAFLNGCQHAQKHAISPDAPNAYLNSELLKAVVLGDQAKTLQLIQAGADPDASVPQGDVKGPTTLMIAAMNGDVAMLKTLIARGSTVQSTDARGWTPLMIAAKYGKIEALRVLLDLGAKIDFKNDLAMTALMVATVHSQDSCTELLLSRGANANTISKQGTTPLMLAAENGDAALTRLLLKSGAAPNAQDQNGFTPLMLAASLGHLRAVQILLEMKADPQIRNPITGKTAFEIAEQSFHPEIAQEIRAKG